MGVDMGNFLFFPGGLCVEFVEKELYYILHELYIDLFWVELSETDFG
jgi:hypothetical protein